MSAQRMPRQWGRSAPARGVMVQPPSRAAPSSQRAAAATDRATTQVRWRTGLRRTDRRFDGAAVWPAPAQRDRGSSQQRRGPRSPRDLDDRPGAISPSPSRFGQQQKRRSWLWMDHRYRLPLVRSTSTTNGAGAEGRAFGERGYPHTCSGTGCKTRAPKLMPTPARRARRESRRG